MGRKVSPMPSEGAGISDYGEALYCKNQPSDGVNQDGIRSTGSHDTAQDDTLTRLRDVGDKRTLFTAAELGLVQQYRELKLAGQEILQTDFPYHYSSILYAAYGNQYKILQLVEREFASGTEDLTTMHTTRCWIGKNSAMVAAYQGHLETLLYIVDLDLQGKFGDVDLFRQRDFWGKTPMDWAASQGHTDTLEVLVIRSLYKLLPTGSTDPLVLRTRWKLVALLRELARHCRDYDPNSRRRFFEEVLASIDYNPESDEDEADEAAEAAATLIPDRTGAAEISWDLDNEIEDAGAILTGADPDAEEDADRAPRASRERELSKDGRTAGAVTAPGDPSGRSAPPLPGAVGTVGAAGAGAGRRPSGADGRISGVVEGSGRGVGGALGRGSMGGAGVKVQGGNGGGAASVRSQAGLQGSGAFNSTSTLIRPTGAPRDLHITVGMLMDVTTAAYRAGMNCMGVIMYIQNLLQQARYFDDLAARCTAWEVALLDTCRNKVEVQAVLTPTAADPSDPVSYSLGTFDKAFLSHKYVQQIFTEKWDTMGVSEYMKSVMGVASTAITLAFSFVVWAVACPLVIVLRSFFSPMERFLQRGKVIVDSRFPWHVPLFRWLLTQCTFVTFVVLLSYLVFWDSSEATLSTAVAPLNTFVAAWCFAMLVDEVQEYLEEGRAVYLSSGWNMMDITMSTCYLLHYLLKIAVVTVPHARNINVLLVTNDLLAASALMAWFRVVSVLELSSSIGPLIQMMKQMLLQDVTRFAVLVIVILMAFTVGMQALFSTVCLEVDANNTCTSYSTWDYDWHKEGLIGGLTYLQYVALGSVSVTDFEQKRVTGIIFYMIFAIVTSILLLNLFIAMLADTYTRVSTKAQVEFRYRKACIMAAFSRREAICPPFNLLMLVCGSIGNALRRLVFGRHGFTPAPVRKNDASPLFSWYFPKGEELAEVKAIQQRVVAAFLRSVRVGLVKDRLQGDLPILMQQLLAANERNKRNSDNGNNGIIDINRTNGNRNDLGAEGILGRGNGARPGGPGAGSGRGRTGSGLPRGPGSFGSRRGAAGSSSGVGAEVGAQGEGSGGARDEGFKVPGAP